MKIVSKQRPLNVLFLCTGNSARSIIAESVLNRLGMGRFKAYSAGSKPLGHVHPYALDLLRKMNYDTSNLRSKSWEEFAKEGAPDLDFVFTVCDNAAGETCPVWPGQPMTAHWGIEDPAAVDGTPFQQQAAFNAALRFMRNRITAFMSLPLASIDRMALSSKLRGIGAMEGATGSRGEVA
jgi:arsenate reductase